MTDDGLNTLTGTDTEAAASQRSRAVELDRHIGERLRFMRRLSSLSQRQVADEIGLSFQQLQKYESGANRVSAALLAEFSGLFHLPMDWFIGPFNSYHERDEAPAGGTYAFMIEKLFGAFRNRSAAECDAALALLCQIAQVNPGPAQTRLFRLRRAMRDGTEQTTAFLRDVVVKLADAHAGTATWPTEMPVAAPQLPFDNRPKILLVDDDADVLTMLTASLAGAGFLVISAHSGDEALVTLAAHEDVSAIVTDFAMVGMDGVELLAQAGHIRPGLPGLVITGFADAARLRDLPADIEVLNKPFRRIELIGRVRLLAEGSARRMANHARAELTVIK